MWGKLFRILLCVAFWMYIFMTNARSVEEDRAFFVMEFPQQMAVHLLIQKGLGKIRRQYQSERR